ncbi:MAG TPA: fructose PTS transporter subunit IIA, partial [Treponemataceae bacterium]|nr:fructose PTS transporter subunit IIA [Treponemataceae bacterium]
KHSYDFSICALGIALLLAGLFERQGLAMIIGAYVTGLSLSKTDIAAVIQERIHGLYEFFVPLFFAVMGMLVNVGELMSPSVIVFGLIYTGVAILAKIIGCGLPTLALGFNAKGAARIGMGMIPRGEVALIIAGIGIAAGVLNEQLFGVTIMMTLITTLVAPPLLNMSLKIPGRGTRKEAKSSDMEAVTWDFRSDEIADLVIDTLLKDLKAEGFYVQMMNIDDGLSQARKGDVALSITELENTVTIETAPEDVPFVRTSVYEVIVKLNDSISTLKESIDPLRLKQESSCGDARTDKNLLKMITSARIKTNLTGTTKEEILKELVGILRENGDVEDPNAVVKDLLTRERNMSTGMQNGIAIPHCKTDAIQCMRVAIGIKRDGIDFNSLDGLPSKVFILIVSPRKAAGPHLQFLASIGTLLRDKTLVEKIIKAHKPEEIEALLVGHQAEK